MKKSIFALIAALAFALPMTVFAQTGNRVPNPIIITEEEANDSFFVTNPPGRRWDELVVDYQTDQAVISGELTLRVPRGQGTTTYSVQAVYTVSVSNGRVFWTLQSVTADGAAASQDIVNQVNASLSSSWRNYVRENGRGGRITDVVLTDTDLQIFWS
ncbi:MAG: hypothetical protein SF162_10500 [bacterium]|nr:hypothetical protein [bacterium]